MRKIQVFGIALFACSLGCTPFMFTRSTQKSEKEDQIDFHSAASSATSKKLQLTFLDTLNAGNEVRLTSADFGITPQTDQKQVATGAATLYRVQLFVSSRIETLREQKKIVETTTELPLHIAFEAPYYKLLAGEFTKRKDAEAVLIKFRNTGFPDAWIVTKKMIPGS